MNIDKILRSTIGCLFALILIHGNFSGFAEGSTPCQGDTAFSEDFKNGIPPTWTVLDIDSLIPNDTTSWTGSWEPFDVDGDLAVANTSWYSPPAKSDDYLITPSLVMDGSVASCLSFRTRSRNATFKDGYEVRISRTGATAAGMQADTALFTESGESDEWTTHTLDLSAYMGDTIHIGFWHNANDKDVLYLDDILVTKPKQFDLAVKTLGLNKKLNPGTYTISGTIENFGSTTIISMDLSWSDGTNTTVDNLVGLNITPYSIYNYSSTVQFNASTAGTYSILVWTSNPNGTNDQDQTNDSLSQLGAISNGITASKTLLIEEFTGAWCGACPDGHWVIDTLKEKYSNVIDVRIHSGDDMTLNVTADLETTYPSFWPAGLLDRIPYNTSDGTLIALHRKDWPEKTAERLNSSTPVIVDIEKTWTDASREIDITITAKFVDYAVGDVRFLAYIAESNITGTGDGYDQRNFFNSVAGSKFFGLGDPIVGYVHNDVVRDAPLGVWGLSDVIPSTVSPGDSFSTNFKYTVPSNYKESDIRIIASVYVHSSDINERDVLNSQTRTLWTTGLEEKPKEAVEASTINSIYPNPVNDIASVKFTLVKPASVKVHIFNILGERLSTVKEGKFTKGAHYVYFTASKLPAGMYFISIDIGDTYLAQKFVVDK
ncbi:choice-of-anchor J domain-containing protein [Candidatus Amoebophilus asiaticus]|nr:choice-of-anchor J domain-containing protein [Candidatus Amoebophilus asiaticus]